MNKSSPLTSQVSVELNTIEESVLRHILSAADEAGVLSPQRIADQMPYAPETVAAAIDRLLALGLVQVAMNDDLMG